MAQTETLMKPTGASTIGKNYAGRTSLQLQDALIGLAGEDFSP